MAFVCIIGSLSFPTYSFASDSGATAAGVAQDATETEWNKLDTFLTQALIPKKRVRPFRMIIPQTLRLTARIGK